MQRKNKKSGTLQRKFKKLTEVSREIDKKPFTLQPGYWKSVSVFWKWKTTRILTKYWTEKKPWIDISHLQTGRRGRWAGAQVWLLDQQDARLLCVYGLSWGLWFYGHNSSRLSWSRDSWLGMILPLFRGHLAMSGNTLFVTTVCVWGEGEVNHKYLVSRGQGMAKHPPVFNTAPPNKNPVQNVNGILMRSPANSVFSY